MQSQTLPSRAYAPNLTGFTPGTEPDGYTPAKAALTGCSTNRLNDGSGRPPLRELYVNICKYLYLWKIWLKIHTHSLRLWIMSQKSIGAGIHRSQMQSQTLLSRAYAPNLTGFTPAKAALTGCSTNRLSGCGGRWRLYLSDAADGGRLPMRELYVKIKLQNLNLYTHFSQ